VRICFIDALVPDGQKEKSKIVADEIRALDPSIGVAGFIKCCDNLPEFRDRLSSNLAEIGCIDWRNSESRNSRV
jgi:hypothetical protein